MMDGEILVNLLEFIGQKIRRMVKYIYIYIYKDCNFYFNFTSYLNMEKTL